MKPEAVVWKGDPVARGAARGEFVRVFLEKKNKDHETLFQRILG